MTDNWIGAAANWNTASDWSAGIPGVNSIVDITQGAPVITTAVSIASLLNSGNLSVAPNGSLSVSGNFANLLYFGLDAGHARGGAKLTVDGLLNNTRLLQLGDLDNSLSQSDTVTVGSLSNTGTLDVSGGGSLSAQMLLRVSTGVAGFGAAGVLNGNVKISGYGKIQFASGSISTIAKTGVLTLFGAHAFVADAGGAGANSALTGLEYVVGGFGLEAGAFASISGPLENDNILHVDNVDAGGSVLKIAGALTNKATLRIGNNGLTLNASIDAAALTNATTGNITLYGGQTGAGEAILDVASAAGFGTVGTLTGAVTLSGKAELEFASGGVGTIAGALTLTGPNAFLADSAAPNGNSALAALNQVKGTLTLQSGASVAATGNLTNAGVINIADVAAGPAMLNVSGVITNQGTINLNPAGVGVAVSTSQPFVNDGVINVESDAASPGGARISVSALANDDVINVDAVGAGGSNLNVTGDLFNDDVLTVGGDALTRSVGLAANSIHESSLNAMINMSGGVAGSAMALFKVGGSAGFGSQGVLSGTVTLSERSEIEFASGEIDSISLQGRLTLDGAQAFVADASAIDANSALQGLDDVAGALNLEDGAAVVSSANLTNTGSINVDGFGGGGSTLTIEGDLTDETDSAHFTTGDVTIGNQSLTANATVNVAAITNNAGSYITLIGRPSATFQALLNVAGAAGFGTAGVLTGTVNLTGDFRDRVRQRRRKHDRGLSLSLRAVGFHRRRERSRLQ